VDQTDASAFTVATLRERLEQEPGASTWRFKTRMAFARLS